MMSEMATAATRGFPGFTRQKKPSWVRHENSVRNSETDTLRKMMIILLLFLQKQSLASAIYLFGLGTLLSGPGLKKKAYAITLSP